LLPFIEKH